MKLSLAVLNAGNNFGYANSSLGYDYMRFDVRGRYFMFSIDEAL